MGFEEVFIKSFSRLAFLLRSAFLQGDAFKANPLFTPFMQRRALSAIAEEYLTEEALKKLLSFSDDKREMMQGKTVGIIMAGNIPAVGFHDLLSALSTGANAVVKLSSKDRYLIPAMIKEVGSEISNRVHFLPLNAPATDLNSYRPDVILFSGSDENKALLSSEFKGVPLVARGSRFSCGVLTGRESEEELEGLAEDMFLYCGLGCRSISYLLAPKGFDFKPLVKAAQKMKMVSEISAFANSVTRQRALLTMEGEDFIDGGFFIMRNTSSVFPPMGCVNFSFYESKEDLGNFCTQHAEQIQKIFTKFGIAQRPKIDEWMDGINSVNAITEAVIKNK